MSPFEEGKQHGMWDEKKALASGFASVHKYYERLEKNYRQNVADLPGLRVKNPAYAREQEKYLEGWIQAVRSSYHALPGKKKGGN